MVLVLLIHAVLFLMRTSPPDSMNVLGRKLLPDFTSTRYVVIFDAVNSGTRVQVFSFDRKLNLVPVGNYYDFYAQTKPGLDGYVRDSRAAAYSLSFLLEQAEAVVPQELRHKTPVRVGVTECLVRRMGGDASDRVLESVRDYLKNKSSLKFKPDWVTVLDVPQEGAYRWVSINYLLGRLGRMYSETVGLVDLDYQSLKMTYAISDSDAAKAPKTSNGEGSYVQDMYLKGRKYHLYVHRYLPHHGLLAARVEILKVEKESGSSCILAGYNGYYRYGHATYSASAKFKYGSSFAACREVVIRAMKLDEPCTRLKCAFRGPFIGGGVLNQKNPFLSSSFFDRAVQAGFVDPSSAVAKVHPGDFELAARRACEASLEEAKHMYPRVDPDELPYLCMDLVYQFTLLIEEFGLRPWTEITLVKKVEYNNSLLEPVWTLGRAVELVSSHV